MSLMIKSEKSPKGQTKILPYSWHTSQRQSRSIPTYISPPLLVTLPSPSIHQPVRPNIRHKLRQLEKGPETLQRDLLEVAFKVFNNREEEAKREKEPERKAKYAFLVTAVKGRDQPGPSHPRMGLKTHPTWTLLLI